MNFLDVRIPKRVWEKLLIDSEKRCWLWYGAKAGRGTKPHGQTRDFMQHKKFVHVFLWEMENGPTPDGKILHHTCFNALCANPGHLLPVTPKEHAYIHIVARVCINGHYKEIGKHCKTCDRIRQQNRRNTCKKPKRMRLHCPNGHRRSRLASGRIICRECNRLAVANYRINNPKPTKLPRLYCSKGHLLSADNMVRASISRNTFVCKICHRDRVRVLRQRKKESDHPLDS